MGHRAKKHRRTERVKTAALNEPWMLSAAVRGAYCGLSARNGTMLTSAEYAVQLNQLGTSSTMRVRIQDKSNPVGVIFR
jgi:hypothetical protein